MPNDSAVRPLHDLLTDIRIAMVMTSENGVWTSRPLTCLDVDRSSLRFLVDGTADWVTGLASPGTAVHVTFSDPKQNTFVSVNGTPSVVDDRAEIDRLWTAAAAAFFHGPEDADIRVLQVDVTDGSWWDGPSGRVGQAVGLLRAAINDDPSLAGDHGTIAV